MAKHEDKPIAKYEEEKAPKRTNEELARLAQQAKYDEVVASGQDYPCQGTRMFCYCATCQGVRAGIAKYAELTGQSPPQ
jgi:hypothetical protein